MILFFSAAGGLAPVSATGEGTARLLIPGGALPYFLPGGQRFLYSKPPDNKENGVFAVPWTRR